MDRIIFYLGGPCIRFHKFYQGDDDRAPHTHPWNFVTFPLASYVELVEEYAADRETWNRRYQIVKRFNFHYRPASHRHVVIGRTTEGELHLGGKVFNAYRMKKPFWTIVLAGHRKQSWGFYPTPEQFVYWRDWK